MIPRARTLDAATEFADAVFEGVDVAPLRAEEWRCGTFKRHDSGRWSFTGIVRDGMRLVRVEDLGLSPAACAALDRVVDHWHAIATAEAS